MPPKPKANADPAEDAKNPDPLGDVPVCGILGQPVAPPLPKPPKSYSESIPASTLTFPVLICMIGMDGRISNETSTNVD